jgi:hypothetical protein
MAWLHFICRVGDFGLRSTAHVTVGRWSEANTSDTPLNPSPRPECSRLKTSFGREAAVSELRSLTHTPSRATVSHLPIPEDLRRWNSQCW